jgi:hypothetical protein
MISFGPRLSCRVPITGRSHLEFCSSKGNSRLIGLRSCPWLCYQLCRYWRSIYLARDILSICNWHPRSRDKSGIKKCETTAFEIDLGGAVETQFFYDRYFALMERLVYPTNRSQFIVSTACGDGLGKSGNRR